MNIRIEYRWNNGEINDIITDGNYDFGDWLHDNGVQYEYDEESDTYYVTADGEKTGEEYVILKTENTMEDLRG